MPIIINLDVMMAKRKAYLSGLAEKIDITNANLSILKNKQGQGHSLFYLGKAMPGA